MLLAIRDLPKRWRSTGCRLKPGLMPTAQYPTPADPAVVAGGTGKGVEMVPGVIGTRAGRIGCGMLGLACWFSGVAVWASPPAEKMVCTQAERSTWLPEARIREVLRYNRISLTAAASAPVAILVTTPYGRA